MKTKPSREWATFLPIPNPGTSDQALALDPGWCAAKGINPSSPIVLRLLRDQVIPLVRRLGSELSSFHFLVHDRNSGVPTTEDDHGAYIHLHLFFNEPFMLKSSPNSSFRMTRPVHPARHGDSHHLPLLDRQSMWVINFIEVHAHLSDEDLVQVMRQQLHYFANMTQINVS